MATSQSRPALQLFEQAFSQPSQRQRYAGLATYLSDGSIFPLVEQGVRGLVRTYALTEDDAKAFLEQANALAIYVRRQFIEHTLFSDPATAPGPQSGLLSMVEGPSFQRLFNVNFAELSPPDALESCYSPVAYLIDLLVWIRDKIEPQGKADKLTLASRRTDLSQLSIDFNAVHQPVSAVDIIVEVLETFITAHSAATLNLEEALSTARYPSGLPYFQPGVSLDYVARHNGLTIGDFVQRVDLGFPYFLSPATVDIDAARARLLASRLGPYQRLILTESPATEELTFYQRHFGVIDTAGTEGYREVPIFCERTQLDAQQLEALLSIRGFAPVRSVNGPPSSEAADIRAGSVYINAGASAAAWVDIEFATPVHRLTNALIGPIDRMNRKLRLDQWLGLPPEQTDALLAAAIKAELPANTTYAITEGGVQALGLFQTLRERYGCSAEDFAAFIQEMSYYGRGDHPSLFDRVFNAQGDYRDALTLDNALFDILPVPGTSELTVSRLCSGLGIDLLTYSFVAQAVSMATSSGAGKLARSLPVVSGFYRLVRLSRLLGITPIEGVLLLTVLGGESWVKALAGVPKIQAHTANNANVLVVIEGLYTCVSWCREHDIEVRWLVQQVSEPADSQKETAAEWQLFEQVRNLLSGALLSNAELLMAGVPALPAGADWLELLSALVDADGLVITELSQEENYPGFAREELLRAVRDGLGERYEAESAAIVEVMLGVLLRAEAAQRSVVKECLAVHTGLASEQVIPVLTWAGGRVSSFLRQVLTRPRPELEIPGRTARVYDGDAFLLQLAQVRRRSEIVLKLALSEEVLQDYLDYGNREWITQSDPLAVSFNTFYYLATLAHAFTLSEQPQAALLDYLRDAFRLPKDIVAGAPPRLSAHAWALARQAAAARLAVLFGWSSEDVLECAHSIGQPLIRTLQQLDMLVRMRTLAARSGMDARTLLLIGQLPASAATAVEKEAYEVAAEKAVLSLSDISRPELALAGDEPAQTVQITCELASPSNSVIAGKPGEKVIYKVTVTNMQGTPMIGVFVHWQATLGTIEEDATSTAGEVLAHFIPGKIQGEETPLFWLDMGEKLPAPAVAVIAESSTYDFPPALASGVPEYDVPPGIEVELYGVMEDDYHNRGINSPVNWSYEPVSPTSGEALIRASAVTNQEGLARAFVSSPTGGSFRFKVRSGSSDTGLDFEPITFLPGSPAA
ncbi:Tc toxin subunit A [Pseudomonas sp. SZMC_28357]|uniref:Tc toxin subunit A n=1 Tax=Pseudomonas sp. SZMC_28357 TaxID=3074380 RepID=UPI002871BA56|nr:Tc toxin subunit A [Pseudomonas sp. SZMC_28357]MDR9754609.1 Tc toxin subunit A [Pseudomonas sp. SZMC_28357]